MLELNMFGDNAVFDHIGLAVRSIRDVVKDDLEIISDEIQKVSVAFVKIGEIKIELIEPLCQTSPIALSLIKDHKLVHLCFRVPALEIAINKGRENGFHRISKPAPAIAFKNKRIVWLYSKVYGLIELLEE